MCTLFPPFSISTRYLFYSQITAVEFGGKLAPTAGTMSDDETIWLAVGITLAIFLAILLIYIVS